MKRPLYLLAPAFLLLACNNSSKDSVEIADSVNKAMQDSAINNNNPLVDEGSSSFLVRVADAGQVEIALTNLVIDMSANTQIIDFAKMLSKEQTQINRQIRTLASQKKVVLPEVISDENKKDIDLLKTSKENVDKTFINMMISKHQGSVDIFEKAAAEVSDYDVKTFIEKTLPVIKLHLETAKSLLKKFQ